MASAIIDDDRFVFFVSGVSDSTCEDNEQYQRERTYLNNINPRAHIFYFSTLSVFYNESRYTQHKELMERSIRSNFNFYTIVRIGNIVWGKNKYCMIPFFKDLHKRGGTPDIQDVYRNILTIEEFQYWMELFKQDPPKEASITGRLMKVNEIWEKVKNGYY